MSHGELEGVLKGHAAQAAMQEHLAKMQEFSAHAEEYAAQARQRDELSAENRGVGDFLNNYYNAPKVSRPADDGEGDTMVQADPTHAERLQFATARAGKAGGRVLERAVESLSKYAATLDDTDLTTGFDENEKTGEMFAHRGKQLLPAGVNPNNAASRPTLLPMHDQDGKLVGWSQVDVRGHATFHQAKSTDGVFTQARDPNGNFLKGVYIDGQGKTHDLRSVLQKTLGDEADQGGGGSTANGAGPVRVTSKAERDKLAKGTRYIGPDGVTIYIKK